MGEANDTNGINIGVTEGGGVVSLETGNGKVANRIRWQKFFMAISGLACLLAGLVVVAFKPDAESAYYAFCGAVVPLVASYIYGNIKEHEISNRVTALAQGLGQKIAA